jgi:hypothetical protein
VSPDGKYYAYQKPGKDIFDASEDVIHIVDVATGHDQTYRAVPAGSSPELYAVLNYAAEGIYLGKVYEGPTRGLWRMDPNNGVISKVAELDDVRAIDGSAAWLGSVNPADPSHPPGGLVTPADTIDRFDLVTGVRTTWAYFPGLGVGVVGLGESGHPIVEAGSGSLSDDIELWLLTGPGTANRIFKGAVTVLWDPSRPGGFGNPIADSHGVWFGSSAGIFFYSPTRGFQKVSDLAFYPGNGCIA